MASLIDGMPVQFAADVSTDQEGKMGIMADGIYDYKSIYGISFKFDKADWALFRNSVRNHGMVFVGVDVKDGRPLKWKTDGEAIMAARDTGRCTPTGWICMFITLS